MVAVLALPPAELAASGAPIALVFERSTGASSAPISAIAMVSVLNGALIQIVMASRVLYGLSAQGWLPTALGAVDARTRTPLAATALATALAFALWLPLITLAQLSSVIALVVFALANMALLRVQRRAPRPPGIFACPAWVPAIGFVVSAAFAAFQVAEFLAY